MNETTCVTVAKSNLQTEARTDQSTSGQQSTSPRHFTDTLECIFLFVFLHRRFAIWKVIQMCCVLFVGLGHSAECSGPVSHGPLQPPDRELWGGEWTRPPWQGDDSGDTKQVPLVLPRRQVSTTVPKDRARLSLCEPRLSVDYFWA